MTGECSSSNKCRSFFMWAGLTVLILLTVLCVCGAFLGAEVTERLFNSMPLAVCWVGFTGLLAAAIAVFARLRRSASLFLMHAGCILILTGAIWASAGGYSIRKSLFGADRLRKGQMAIYQGQTEGRVVMEHTRQIRQLPFAVRLNDFRIEYYKPGLLHISAPGKSWNMPAEPGRQFATGPDCGMVEVLRVFENFRITIDGEQKMVIDAPGAGSNPAIEVRIRRPDGTVMQEYVFERFPGRANPQDGLALSYHRPVRQYVSDVQIIEDGKVTAEKSIRVNHPLHLGGYHLYQHSYDESAGDYTILMVVGDSGLYAVYAGYVMLCFGAVWHFWLRPLFKAATAERS